MKTSSILYLAAHFERWQSYVLAALYTMNTYLKYQPPGVQLVAFMGMAIGFMVINLLIMSFFFGDLTAVLMDKTAVIQPELVAKFKVAQVISAVVSFLFPALLFGYFSSPKALPYVGIQSSIAVELVIACFVFLVVVQPFVGWIGIINNKINFGSLQKVMQAAEASYSRALQVFLQMKNAGDLFINLFIMALLPAVSEELFFRGALQKVMLRLMNIPVIAILFSAAIFAVLHGTVFKVLPIFTLGILLGTIYHVTRNLWYTIIIHFLNNGLAVLAVYYSTKNDFMKKLANDQVGIEWYAAIFSLLGTVAILVYMHRKSQAVLPAAVTDEDNDYIA